MNESIIRFLKEDNKRNVISYGYKSSSGNDILHLEFFNTEDIPAEETIKSGVLVYNPDNDLVQGDFSNFITIYKHKENIYELSIDEVYVESPIVIEPIKKYTDEELKEIEKNNKISELNSQINDLKRQLDSTDYMIIKAYEYSLVGKETGYDIKSLHKERDIIREQINNLENMISELNL